MKTMSRFKQCMALNAAFLILLGCQKRMESPPLAPELGLRSQMQAGPLVSNLSQTTTVLTPVADAGMEAARPNSSTNGGTIILSENARYGLLKFDLSYLADSSNVEDIALTMINKYTPAIGADANISFDLFAIPAQFNNWVESSMADATGKPYTEAVTWQNTVGTGKLATVTLATPVLATATIIFKENQEIKWISPQLTQSIKQAIATSPNKVISFLVRRSPNSQGNSPYLYTREVASKAPKLYVYEVDQVARIKASYNLVWNDEFDGTKMDTSKWMYRYQGARRHDAYVDNNKTVSLDGKGNMVIKVIQQGKDKEGRDAYYVGQVYTGDKFAPTYGYYECRAKMNRSVGPHVAFWLQSGKMGAEPYNSPDINGAEIDIFEFHRKNPDTIWQTIHINGYGAFHKTNSPYNTVYAPYVKEGYHTFGLLWTDTSYTFFIDGKKTKHTNFGVSKYKESLILSTELTGFGGPYQQGPYPDSVVFDYVRVYQAKP